jgi:hypothetical protein
MENFLSRIGVILEFHGLKYFTSSQTPPQITQVFCVLKRKRGLIIESQCLKMSHLLVVGYFI